MWYFPTTSPSILFDPSPDYEALYNDDVHHTLGSVSSLDFAFPTSGITPPGPYSASSITPITSGLISPSYMDYASLGPPSTLNVSRPTLAHTALGPVSDVHHTVSSSIPMSPYPSLLSSWHMPNTVRNFSFILPSLF